VHGEFGLDHGVGQRLDENLIGDSRDSLEV